MSADASVRALLSRLPHYSQYSQARQEPLRPNDPVYAHLEQGFVQRVTRHRGPKQGDPHREAPKLKVVRIEQIFSKRLQDKYLAAVQDEIGLCGSKLASLQETIEAIPVHSFEGTNMNEFLLYHGAPTGLIPRLVLQGLDPRNAGTHFGKLFGAGTYLASHSSKSDIYTKRCALLVRACLGEPHTAKTPMREALRPPERPDKRGPLSSVVAATVGQGGGVEHPEFIVYKDSQTLPQVSRHRTRPGGSILHSLHPHLRRTAVRHLLPPRGGLQMHALLARGSVYQARGQGRGWQRALLSVPYEQPFGKARGGLLSPSGQAHGRRALQF